MCVISSDNSNMNFMNLQIILANECGSNIRRRNKKKKKNVCQNKCLRNLFDEKSSKNDGKKTKKKDMKRAYVSMRQVNPSS